VLICSLMRISLVYTYYDNPETLKFLVDSLNGYAAAIRSSIEVVVVDDASPSFAAHLLGLEPKFSLRIFRVQNDKAWNHRAARNIGAHEAKAPWLFLLDVDTLVPEETLARLLTLQPHENEWFLFSRRDAWSGEKIRHHHDTIFISRVLYWEVGGFDENYAGIYGAGAKFSLELERKRPFVLLDELEVVLLSRGFMKDAATTQFKRRATLGQRLKIRFVDFARSLGLLQRKSLRESYFLSLERD